MKKPLLSVVTVSYNASREIGKTIASVKKQTWTDFEYLFIDGASRDDTVACIEDHRADLEKRGISCRVISEPDKGIYDAMNKAIALAEGQWILMLNAGDILASETVLERVFRDVPAEADVLYGHMIMAEINRGKTYYRKVPAKPLDFFAVGMPFCHQSVFARTDALRRFPFHTSYRLVADYDQFLRLHRSGAVFCPVDVYVSVFESAGVSMRSPLTTLREYDRVRQDLGMPGTAGGLKRFLARGKGALRNSVKKLLPGWFYSASRGWSSEFPRDL